MLPNRNMSLTSERQSKFIQERITSVEKYFSDLCTSFATYARKVARLRDSGDQVSKSLKLYADNETVNKSLSSGLSELSSTLCAIEEYRNAQAQRLEVKVVSQLSQYEGICRHVRGEIKHTLSLRDNEIARKKTLDRIKERNPHNRQQIIHAEAELLKATADMSRTTKELEEQTDSFEKQKLQNMSSILKDFIKIELAFHAKALELYSVAYRQINNVDNESDLYDYQMQLQLLDGQQSLHKQPGLGSIASLLGQEKAVETKAKESETSSENSDEFSESS